MDNLIIDSTNNSPLKTMEKKVKESRFLLKHLTGNLSLNTDQILKMMNNNNNEIVEKILIKDKISKDKNCGYFSMTKKTKHCYSNRCKGCQIINRLIKTVLLETDTIEIYFGRKKGKNIKISRYNFFDSPYKENKTSSNLSSYISKEVKIFQCDISPEHRIKFYSTENKYYNYVINSIIINRILEENSIFLYNDFLWSFVCRNTINIMKIEKQYKSLEDLTRNPYFSNYSSPIITKIVDKNLSKTTTLNILKQLIILLESLSDNFFIHGKPSVKYINYSSETVTLTYKEENITFPIKISLNLSLESSINYNNCRFFYCQDNVKNYGLPVEKIDFYFNGTVNYCEKNNRLGLEDEYQKIRLIGYKIGNRSDNFLKILRNGGVPLFNKSFEFICFITSYISDKYFWNSFKECDKELEIWKGLWKKEEYELLMKDLKDVKDNSFEDIFKIIKNYYIRIDALRYFYENL